MNSEFRGAHAKFIQFQLGHAPLQTKFVTGHASIQTTPPSCIGSYREGSPPSCELLFVVDSFRWTILRRLTTLSSPIHGGRQPSTGMGTCYPRFRTGQGSGWMKWCLELSRQWPVPTKRPIQSAITGPSSAIILTAGLLKRFIL